MRSVRWGPGSRTAPRFLQNDWRARVPMPNGQMPESSLQYRSGAERDLQSRMDWKRCRERRPARCYCCLVTRPHRLEGVASSAQAPEREQGEHSGSLPQDSSHWNLSAPVPVIRVFAAALPNLRKWKWDYQSVISMSLRYRSASFLFSPETRPERAG